MSLSLCCLYFSGVLLLVFSRVKDPSDDASFVLGPFVPL